SVSPPPGPSATPAFTSRTHGIAPAATSSGVEVESIESTALAQTMLESRECCHVARTVLFSSGLGLKKCVMTCLARCSNRGASGVKRTYLNPAPEGKQMEVLVAAAVSNTDRHLR